MARCSCATADTPSNECNCAIVAGANTTVTGNGSAGTPFVINAVTNQAQVRAALSATNGVTYNSATGVFMAYISADPGNAIVLDNDGGLFVPSPLGSITFTSNGSWDPAANPLAKMLRIRAIGGGGGSASTGSTLAGQGIARGGGAGGTYTESWVAVSTLVGTQTVTVGAGGTAGSPAGTATAGGAGGTSSFGAAVTAPGGGGSTNTPAPGAGPLVSAGGAAGATGTGQISISGGPGTAGFFQAVGIRMGGAGGAAASLSADGVTNYALGVGLAGRNYGGGASGSASDGAAAGQLGAAGAPGVVIVEMFG